MTKGDLDGKLFLNRPIKPLAGIMMCLMFVLAYFNLANSGYFHDYWLGDVVAGISLVAATSLFAGWWSGVQRMAEAGLLLAGISYIMRSLFILFMTGLNHEIFWQSFLIGFLSLAAFYLEARDSTYKKRKGIK